MRKNEAVRLWNILRQVVHEELAGGQGCHDFEHTKRVIRNAELLSASEHPDELTAVRFGALLHDIARPEEFASGGKLCHALLGAEKSERLLRKYECTDESFIRHVSDIVRTHRYRGGNPPATLEAKIVYDADKLDSLGAFGIARAFHFAGRVGACIHNTEEKAVSSPAYGPEDSAYREYLVKLRHLPERMLTESGRKLALSRAELMNRFFDSLNQESAFDFDLDLFGK